MGAWLRLLLECATVVNLKRKEACVSNLGKK